jgi:hydroxymethylglutaryl-CoA lyase
MTDIPKFVTFHEEGPREGFQIEPAIYSIEDRVSIIDALAETGLKQIQVASFVNPKAVPSMADAAELFAAIKPREDVRFTALWLNETGFRRAQSTPNVDLKGFLMFYLTDAFSQNNNNCTVAEHRERQKKWIPLYLDAGLPIESVYIVTAFGCNLEGEVPIETLLDTVRYVRDLSIEFNIPMPRLFLADTVGWANPMEIKRRIGAVRNLVPEAKIGTHLHDTRGMGPANVLAALEMGVDLFESSIAGLGGCPFAAHANSHGAGNICTEDMVYMCEEMGIATGIDVDKLLVASEIAEKVFGRPLSGKLMHAGRLKRKAA